MRDKIRRIYARAPHPLAALWRWAKGKTIRFKALVGWATYMAQHNAHGHWVKTANRYSKKAEWLARHHDPKNPGPGGYLTTLDGLTVPRWIAEILVAARRKGYWHGTVISGYRSPEYSEQLCRNMCGAPTCPGLCGGVNSNHSCPPSHVGTPFEGAVDVTDPAGLQRYTRSVGNPLIGNGEALPADTPHFSRTGH